jgi:hypothetical protein
MIGGYIRLLKSILRIGVNEMRLGFGMLGGSYKGKGGK